MEEILLFDLSSLKMLGFLIVVHKPFNYTLMKILFYWYVIMLLTNIYKILYKNNDHKS